MSFTSLTAAEIAAKVRSKEMKAEAITTAYLDRIRALDPKIKAFNEVFAEAAIQQAKSVDSQIDAGKPVGLLAGVPIAIKDNMLIRGQKCTCSSKILEGFVGTYDATVIRRLREAGAI